mgnify:CR=1 FL=1|jgi:hypothetical protein
MKAKNHTRSVNRTRSNRQEEPLPHELGTHLFALIKRNLLARRQSPHNPSADQMTFAF